MRPGEILRQTTQVGPGRATRGLEDENASPMMAHEGGAAHPRMSEGNGFRPEGVEPSARVIDPGGTPAEEPQTASLVEVPRISRAVPADGADRELGLVVAVTVQVSAEHVIPADDDLPRLAGRQAGGGKLRYRVGPDGCSPLVAQDSESDGRHWKTGRQAARRDPSPGGRLRPGQAERRSAIGSASVEP